MKKIIVVLCLLIALLPICDMLSKPVKASAIHCGWMSDTDADPYVGINQQPSLATDSNGILYLADNYKSSSGKYGYRLLKSTDNGQSWSLIATWFTPDFDTIIRNIAIDPVYDYIYLSYQNYYDPSHSWVGVYTYNTFGVLLWSKTIAGESEGVYINPCVTCEYQFGSFNYVYFAYEQVCTADNRDLIIAESLNHGASFLTNYYHDGVDSTASPWITEADGYVYVAYIWNTAYGNGDGQVYVDYSGDRGSSWQIRAHIDGMSLPHQCRRPVVAASHGGGSVLVAYEYDYYGDSSDIDVYSAYSLDFGSTWTGPNVIANFASIDETVPALSVDGQGSTSNSVNGCYHLAYYNGTSEYHGMVMYARASVTSPGAWNKLAYGPSPINSYDVMATYHAWWDTCFAVTTQLRSDGKWYPIVAWPDSTYGISDTNIFVTTPEARANLASSQDNGATANLGSIIFDSATYQFLPGYVIEEAGVGTYQASYIPASGYGFDHWVTTSGVSVSNIYSNPTTATLTNIGGAIPFGTLTAVYVKNTYLVVKGNDNGIYYRSGAGSTWTEWTKLPGATVMSPAATVFNSKLQIVVVGADGSSLWYGNVDLWSHVFSGWTLLSGATPSAPTLASNGTALCLVVRGMDNRIYCSWYTSSWGPWQAVPTGATGDTPAAAILGNDLHIVVRGMDGQGLWDTIVKYDGSVARGWMPLSGATPSKPVLAAYSSSNKLYLVVRGMDNRIWDQAYDGANDVWDGSWTGYPGATIDGPAATVANDKLYVAVRGADGNTLWHGYTSGLNTIYSFSGWTLLSGATPSPPTLAS